MTTPTTFPAWLSKPGNPDTFVTDINGYNAAVANGWSAPVAVTAGAASAGSTMTPTTAIAAPVGVTASVIETQVSPGQLHAVFDQISHGNRK